MNPISEGDLLWKPSPEIIANANLTAYMHWLHEHKCVSCQTYDALWRWSVDHLDVFWQSIWEYCDLKATTPATTILADRTMPGAQWFVGMTLNYAENIFSRRTAANPGAPPRGLETNLASV